MPDFLDFTSGYLVREKIEYSRDGFGYEQYWVVCEDVGYTRKEISPAAMPCRSGRRPPVFVIDAAQKFGS